MSKNRLRIGDLCADQRLSGIVPNQAVTLIFCKELARDVMEIVYRKADNSIDERILTDDDLARIEILPDADATPKLDADPQEFQLAAEALRIKYAALYDPMAAVHSSDVDPLPHQIRAVYEELLPRIPLRFLLADDPGAGKTIMAGLYLKELILRSDCERALIVAPGGLVEQWQEELSQKFDLAFEIFYRNMVEDALDNNPFQQHPFLIIRMDQVSRNEELQEMLQDVNWDVVVVDEAHRMSARYSTWKGEITETKRFQLGRLLSETAHNFLLMTATPHAGQEEDFQLFMSLLDRDRFEGHYREGVHRTDTTGLMRRMVKEDLLTFEGKPLFPERRAYTVSYELSPAERDLYEQVTDYVRTEMGRAERIAEQGDGRRGNNVGFALTVLQRRLASSPEAILRSLERRKARLSAQLNEFQHTSFSTTTQPMDIIDEYDDETSWQKRVEFETRVDEVIGLATAAQNIPDLQCEIKVLGQLIDVARDVRYQDEDRKWVELRTILDEKILSHDSSGAPRKIIIFTEHRDTLSYLHDKITGQLGRAEAVLTIHGGTSREERKRIREEFTHNPDSVVLLATDAAGEGLNLQRAHLMVNYDLPWNPNRIEQRFGRIHRIGQREVCHLWNLVAEDTREGDVFTRLLSKIANMDRAYNGNLFNVLGGTEAFQQKSLKDLLIEAIRFGDQPETKEKLDKIIDESVAAGLDDIMAEHALHQEMFSSLNLEEVRQRMEKARERKLQPGYISDFFLRAFRRLGGRIHRRETGRYQITRVPSGIIEAARRRNRLIPVANHYERVTFDTQCIHLPGKTDADLLAPGHPLLQAVLDLTINDLDSALTTGAVFIDRSSKQSSHPAFLFTVEQKIITTGEQSQTVSHHFDNVLVSQSGEISVTPAPVYLGYESPRPDEKAAVDQILAQAWVRKNHNDVVRSYAFREGLEPRKKEVEFRRKIDIERTRDQVKNRLLAEINHWDQESSQLERLESEGIIGRITAKEAKAKSVRLEKRLEKRMQELNDAEHLEALPPKICGVALVIPSGLVDFQAATFARDTKTVERRAVEAVLQAEKALGRNPEEMPHNNAGFDIRSTEADGTTIYVEVKGRLAGAETFTITASEVSFAKTQKERHRLALVEVSPNGPEYDSLRYVQQAFEHMEPSVSTQSYNEKWRDYWRRGGPPQ